MAEFLHPGSERVDVTKEGDDPVAYLVLRLHLLLLNSPAGTTVVSFYRKNRTVPKFEEKHSKE